MNQNRDHYADLNLNLEQHFIERQNMLQSNNQYVNDIPDQDEVLYRGIMPNYTPEYQQQDIIYEPENEDADITSTREKLKMCEICENVIKKKKKNKRSKSESDIRNLSNLSNLMNQMSKSRDPQTECIICLEHLQNNQNIMYLKCGHLFHSNCLQKWNKNICPLCKIEYTDINTSQTANTINYNLHERNMFTIPEEQFQIASQLINMRPQQFSMFGYYENDQSPIVQHFY